MKMKLLLLINIFIILLICMITYFMPLSLSDIICEDNEIDIILNTFENKNGAPNIDSVTYQDITAEQERGILALLEEYPYRRALDTPFSSSSISESRDQSLTIFVYDDNSSTDAIILVSSGQIVVNGIHYYMKNAETLIAQIIDIAG